MNYHFRDYYWKGGKPYGRDKVDAPVDTTYKIIADPYYKRISIEKYRHGVFFGIVYDSLFLDFRHLKSPEQASWQRELLEDQEFRAVYLLRDQNDRAILIETLHFEGTHCRSCLISSVHGVSLSIHKMFYKALDEPFDGVVLFDKENRPVMVKTYATDPVTNEFTNLLKEEWDMENEMIGFAEYG